MRFLQYTKYFYYLASNWTIAIALHIIKREITGEKKYGINSTGADELSHLEEKGIDITHATIYMPASYDILEEMYQQLPLKHFNHFLDIGCGKGRALAVAAHFGCKKITGLDFSKKLSMAAEENLLKTKAKFPDLQYKIWNNDAFYFAIEKDVDCLFLFNPFDETIMSAVVENIEESLDEHPRDLTIIYLNSQHKELFFNKGYQQIYHSEQLKYLQGLILYKQMIPS